jgi:recombination protein RecA
MREFIKTTKQEYADISLFLLDDTHTIKTEVIPTGISAIDNAIGVGGIPRGRVTEIWGGEGTCKTTLCLHTIAQAQKMGLGAAFIDVEHAITRERMEQIGVDTSALLMSQPDSAEQALELVEMMARSDKFAVIVLDSVAALIPQAEVEKEMGESVMGLQARMMSQAMRKLTAPISKHNVAVIFTNQTRMNIGGYGAPETTTGGKALQFYASLRLKMQFIGQIKSADGNKIGGKYKMTVVKNKLAVPFKIVEFEVGESGIDAGGAFVDELVAKCVIIKAGSWYKIGEESLAQGERALSKKIQSDPDLKERLEKLLAEQKTVAE